MALTIAWIDASVRRAQRYTSRLMRAGQVNIDAVETGIYL